MSSRVILGARVQVDGPQGDKGTVGYVGPIQGAKLKEYIGIKFDEKRPRGHDGTVKGKRYFQCPVGFGSYLHPRRVLAQKSFVEALEIKYLGKEDPDQKRIDQLAKARKSSPQTSPETQPQASNVDFKLVGEAKIAKILENIESLSQISLDSLRIATAGDENFLKRLKTLENLSLENNLLNSWIELGKILKFSGSRSLKELNISQNQLPALDTKEFTQIFGDTLSSLEVLVMNRVPNVWGIIKALTADKRLENLKELHLCHNKLTTIPHGALLPTNLPKLKLINLEMNSLSNLADLKPLQSFRLSQLMIGGNFVAKLRDSKDDEIHSSSWDRKLPICQSLKEFHLQDNNLGVEGTVQLVDFFRSFESLDHLRLIRNPEFYKVFKSEGDARMFLIATLPRLSMLNLSQVRTSERNPAERFYLRWCIQASKAENISPSKYRFFDEYKKKHGHILLEKKKGLQKLSKRLMKLVFECGTMHKEKKVPPSITISKLKLLSRRLFGLSRSNPITLHFKSIKDGCTQHLDDDSLPLRHYPIGTGDSLLVNMS